jgi:CIC family chloride channel protein
MASFGSGSPGGVFTPSLFMGASAGLLFGTLVNSFWPGAAQDPRAFALVGMGAFLSAASHAPVMAVIMLFEMTLSYDIILPLMLCSVISYYTAKSLQGSSLYSEALRLKAVAAPLAATGEVKVGEMMRPNPPTIDVTARFSAVAEAFVHSRVNHLYVIDGDQRFLGVVSLPNIKPHLGEPDLAGLVLARDIMREDFPRLTPDQPLTEALAAFLHVDAARLPVVNGEGLLCGSIAKSDLLLSIVEQRRRRERT